MHRRHFHKVTFSATSMWLPSVSKAQEANASKLKSLDPVIQAIIKPLMRDQDIPGVSVAITTQGQRYFFNFGKANLETGKQISENTIFELGSISKVFTATLGAYAQALGALSLSDKASRYVPALVGTSFDYISLLNLVTYTPGGLPLQFPAEVTNENVMEYYRNWKPNYAPGTHRVYSNPSLGLFGHLVAQSLKANFQDAMQGQLFPLLGLQSTFTQVPSQRLEDYAFGYREGKPVRVNPGVFDAAAYGVKSTAADIVRFIEANIDGDRIKESMRRAIAATHLGHFKIGGMTQALGWEKYAYPAHVEQLLVGNSTGLSLKPNLVEKLNTGELAAQDLLINKTGSTNGFGAYIAFIPSKRVGVALLANKNYPNAERIKAAQKIIESLV